VIAGGLPLDRAHNGHDRTWLLLALLLCGQDRRVPADAYPRWEYFPRNVRPPDRVKPLVAEVRTIEPRISTVDQRTGLHSDDVLLELAPSLLSARRSPCLLLPTAHLRLPIPLVASASGSRE
jgi:hypothetical protein